MCAIFDRPFREIRGPFWLYESAISRLGEARQRVAQDVCAEQSVHDAASITGCARQVCPNPGTRARKRALGRAYTHQYLQNGKITQIAQKIEALAGFPQMMIRH